jgi:8-amino-7-oxononanoate synthase
MSRPPATPAGVFLLRCSLCAEHSAAQLDTVLERFAMASAVVGLFAEAAE